MRHFAPLRSFDGAWTVALIELCEHGAKTVTFRVPRPEARKIPETAIDDLAFPSYSGTPLTKFYQTISPRETYNA